MSNEAVKVVVRCRPLFGKELTENRKVKAIVDVNTTRGQIILNHPPGKQSTTSHAEPKTFTFDSTYDENTVQKDFYDDVGYPLVESVMEGFNGTIFAYGQTGCGKTFTMQGAADNLRGVIPNSFDHVFDNVAAAPEGVEFLIRCQYLEIYNEEIRDLLGQDVKAKLALKENKDKGVYVQGITDCVCSDIKSINETMERGFENRTVGATLMNAGSSRSHSIFTIAIEIVENDEKGNPKFRVGKLNLVDLAGSERQNKTGATGARLKEGCKINLSLSALGNVISALVDGKSKHIPYRDSKLTRLLQDSLGGNTKTVMVACISPADYNYDETLSTLRYANRAKNIKNKPVINEDPKDAMLREYKQEIEKLRKMLEAQSLQELGAAGTCSPAVMQMGGMGISSPAEVLSKMKAGSDNPLMLSTDMIMQMSGSGSDFATSPANCGQAKLDSEVEDLVQVVEKELIVEKLVEKEVVVEVESEQSKAQRKALESYNEAVVQQRDKLGAAMEAKDQQVEAERKARELLQAKLDALQSKVRGTTTGSPEKAKQDAIEQDPEHILARQQAEYRRAQLKLRAEKKRKARLAAEKEWAEKKSQAVQNELAEAKADHEKVHLIHLQQQEQLTKQLHVAQCEIQDLQAEFQQERADLLELVRDQEKQNQLLKQICALLFSTKEMGKVYERSTWDEDAEAWRLPKLKPRAGFQLVKLPSLNGKSADVADANKQVQGGVIVGKGRSKRDRSKSRRRRTHRDAGDGESKTQHLDDDAVCAIELERPQSRHSMDSSSLPVQQDLDMEDMWHSGQAHRPTEQDGVDDDFWGDSKRQQILEGVDEDMFNLQIPTGHKSGLHSVEEADEVDEVDELVEDGETQDSERRSRWKNTGNSHQQRRSRRGAKRRTKGKKQQETQQQDREPEFQIHIQENLSSESHQAERVQVATQLVDSNGDVEKLRPSKPTQAPPSNASPFQLARKMTSERPPLNDELDDKQTDNGKEKEDTLKNTRNVMRVSSFFSRKAKDDRKRTAGPRQRQAHGSGAGKKETRHYSKKKQVRAEMKRRTKQGADGATCRSTRNHSDVIGSIQENTEDQPGAPSDTSAADKAEPTASDTAPELELARDGGEVSAAGAPPDSDDSEDSDASVAETEIMSPPRSHRMIQPRNEAASPAVTSATEIVRNAMHNHNPFYGGGGKRTSLSLDM